MRSIPFEDYIGSRSAFPVKGWALDSKLMSVPDCQAIIKKAAVERLKAHYRMDWFPETGALHQLQFSIHHDEVTVMLDTSGAGLHKRGYRENANAAPIKETLAAGILDLARVYPDTVFCDPFCGSGTLMIEAAMKALNIPPCIRRKFSAQNFGFIDEIVWREERPAPVLTEYGAMRPFLDMALTSIPLRWSLPSKTPKKPACFRAC